MAEQCHLGKEKVREGLKKLLDAGLIQYAGKSGQSGAERRVWRVTHPDDVEARRQAIRVMGLPSECFQEVLHGFATQERKDWEADVYGQLWGEDGLQESGGDEVDDGGEASVCGGQGKDDCVVAA